MIDFAFIRLETTLTKALETNASSYASIGYFDQIQLSTTGKYAQITNTADGIAFDGNFEVHVSDFCGNHLLDITEKVQITEFTDNLGIQQIYFTIQNIAQDFYKSPVILKFIHTESDYIWYSNPITISDYKIHLTTRFDFRDYKEFDGFAYNRVNNYQSIRLSCAFIGPDVEGSSSEYTSLDGLRVNARMIKTHFEKYQFNGIDNFTYLRLNSLLTHPVVYVNDKRVTNKQTIPSEEPIGGTNLMDIDFKLAVNQNENLFDILNPKDFINKDWNNTDFLTN